MRHAFSLFAITSIAIAATVAVASAQDASPELDLAEIRARASEHTKDAEALATAVRTKADALAQDAKQIQQEANDNRAGYAATAQAAVDEGPFDLDGMIRAQADAEAASLIETPKFIAFSWAKDSSNTISLELTSSPIFSLNKLTVLQPVPILARTVV